MRLLLRVLGLLVLMYAGLSILRGLLRAFTPAGQVRGTAAAGHLVKDPVCGTYVPEATAIHVGDAFFCSETCRRKYELH
jgi:hypothetical protein